MTTRRHDLEDVAALAGEVASRLLALIEDSQAAGRVPHIVLTGGSVAAEVHRELGRVGPASGVDWGAVEFWWGDERWLPEGDPDRNATSARADFLDVVGARLVHEMPASDQGMDLRQAAASYSELVRRSAGHGFDVVMLGMGPDGHVASIFPGHPAGDVDAIVVPVTESPKPPPQRLSLSTEALSHTTNLWFILSGPQKAAVAEQVLSGDSDLPAARVHASDEAIWFIAS